MTNYKNTVSSGMHLQCCGIWVIVLRWDKRSFSKSLVKNAARNDVWLCISARRRARNHRIDVSSGRPLALWWSFIIGRLKWNNLLTRLCELQSTHLLRNIDYLPSVLYNNLTSKWYRNELVKVHLLYRVLPLLNRKYKRHRLVYKKCLVCPTSCVD